MNPSTGSFVSLLNSIRRTRDDELVAILEIGFSLKNTLNMGYSCLDLRRRNQTVWNHNGPTDFNQLSKRTWTRQRGRFMRRLYRYYIRKCLKISKNSQRVREMSEKSQYENVSEIYPIELAVYNFFFSEYFWTFFDVQRFIRVYEEGKFGNSWFWISE